MHELSQELPRAFSPMGGPECSHKKKKKNLGEKFGNIEKILEVLGIDSDYPVDLPKGKFCQLNYINCNASCNIAKTQQ